MRAPEVTVGIIARRRIPELDRLVEALLVIEGPSREIVVGVETPGSVAPEERADERGVRWIALPARRGIGYNRNRVLDAARAELLLGIDDDCLPDPGWMSALVAALDDPEVHAAVGEVRIPGAGYVGDCISALGFPAGGSAGYATMFPVTEDCTTTNLSAGNCAIRTATVRALGGYDESMTFGGEDTELAHRLGAAGKRIVHVPEAAIVHPARTSVREFVRWSYVRGRAKRQFARKVPIGGYVTGRLASFGVILRHNALSPRIFLIVPLLAANVLLQQAGFVAEWVDRTTARPDV